MPGDWKKRSLEDQEAGGEAPRVRLNLAVYLDQNSVVRQAYFALIGLVCRRSVARLEVQTPIPFCPELFPALTLHPFARSGVHKAAE